METMCISNDGFYISEQDLKLRQRVIFSVHVNTVCLKWELRKICLETRYSCYVAGGGKKDYG